MSKIVKIVCSLGLIITSFLKWKGLLIDVSMSEICTMWVTVYALGAGGIDINLLAEKFGKDTKKNG
jgi:hypothetical protein